MWILQLDEEIILQYILDNNLNAEPTGSGLYYVVNSTGNGDFPNINSIVTVAYKGTLTDGTIFDQSSSSGATFPLSNVIQGWQEGIPLFSEGGLVFYSFLLIWDMVVMQLEVFRLIPY